MVVNQSTLSYVIISIEYLIVKLLSGVTGGIRTHTYTSLNRMSLPVGLQEHIILVG